MIPARKNIAPKIVTLAIVLVLGRYAPGVQQAVC
jgi:hypothetical protein